MPAIRFPASAVPLLPLCKGHGENYVFRTYADLIGFIAAYGFHLVMMEGHLPQKNPKFTEAPNPIPFEVFENRNLMANLVLIALAFDQSRVATENDDELSKLIERFADVGAQEASRHNWDDHALRSLLEIVNEPFYHNSKI